MRVVLLRHGNTFAPGQTPVMVGATQDLPLVERGKEQAELCGQALRQCSVRPEMVFCSPLSRTREFAQIILRGMESDASLRETEALREVDFGAWTGLSDPEISSGFGAEVLRAWREDGVWPHAFAGRRNEVLGRWEAWRKQIPSEHSCVLAVTSAGVLRTVLETDASTFDDRRRAKALGFRTGHLGIVEWEGDNTRVRAWDLSPDKFASVWRSL